MTLLALLLPAIPLAFAPAQDVFPTTGEDVIAAQGYLTVPVSGLEITQSQTHLADQTDSRLPFSRSLAVKIGRAGADSNQTQLTLPTRSAIAKGDILLADFYVRGQSDSGRPGQVMFLFERTQSLWTKSVTQSVSTPRNPQAWRHVQIPFASAENYQIGEVMASIRFAFAPQRIEIGGVRVISFQNRQTIAGLNALALKSNPLGKLNIAFDWSQPRQTMVGLGGNFCQPRYGATEPLDAVGRYCLDHLQVSIARLGIPLNHWNPEPGRYVSAGQADASMRAIRLLKDRKIPVVASIWEMPRWLMGGKPEEAGRMIPDNQLDTAIDSITAFFRTAREKYDAVPDYFCFNEPDYGVNVKQTSAQQAEFIRRAARKFRATGVPMRFIVGDTAGGNALANYVRPVLDAADIQSELGPISFHCWDSLTAPSEAYESIARTGREFKRPVWCLEAGHDAQLWQAKDPWATWDNAFRTALAYERTLRLTEASVMAYWTYQDNYPVVSADGKTPYPVFYVLKGMETVFAPGSRVVQVRQEPEDLRTLATIAPNGDCRIMLINPVGSGTVIVGGLAKGAACEATVLDSDSSTRTMRSLTADRDGNLELALPARSVAFVLVKR